MRTKKTILRVAFVLVGLAVLSAMVRYGAHLYWKSWLAENGKRDVTEFVEMLFEPGQQAIRVDVASVEPHGQFGMAINGLQVTALTPETPMLGVRKVTLAPLGISDGRSFEFRAEDIGGSGLLAGKAVFARYDLETDPRAKLEELDAQLSDVKMQTLMPVLRHFTGDTALTTLLSWMSGSFGGSIQHAGDRGVARLIAEDLNMRKLHEMLPSISVDEFDLGIDYSPEQVVFSKASVIRLPNANFNFRGGLRFADGDQRKWDLAVELKTIPILHIVAAPIFGCPQKNITWQTFAGRPSTKIYRISGELLRPDCKVE